MVFLAGFGSPLIRNDYGGCTLVGQHKPMKVQGWFSMSRRGFISTMGSLTFSNSTLCFSFEVFGCGNCHVLFKALLTIVDVNLVSNKYNCIWKLWKTVIEIDSIHFQLVGTNRHNFLLAPNVIFLPWHPTNYRILIPNFSQHLFIYFSAILLLPTFCAA